MESVRLTSVGPQPSLLLVESSEYPSPASHDALKQPNTTRITCCALAFQPHCSPRPIVCFMLPQFSLLRPVSLKCQCRSKSVSLCQNGSQSRISLFEYLCVRSTQDLMLTVLQTQHQHFHRLASTAPTAVSLPSGLKALLQ